MKTQTWESIRRAIKPKFAQAGITRCELRFPGCSGALFLGFAHGKKRRNLSPEEYASVILACTSCHATIERYPEAQMDATVRQTIAQRQRPLPGLLKEPQDSSYHHHLIINGIQASISSQRGNTLVITGRVRACQTFHPGQRVLLTRSLKDSRLHQITDSGHTGDKDEFFVIECQALHSKS